VSSLVLARSATRRQAIRWRLLVLLGSLTIAALGSSALSLALFTDTDSSTWSFTTGTIDIQSSPAVLTSVSGIMPGGTNTQSLTVQNAGTASFRYAMSTVATNTLGDNLQLEVRTLGTSCAAFDGTVVLAATAIDGAAFGNPAQGADAGDRTLAGGASEVLCFRASLPIAAGNPLQGTTSDVTFTFDAEQTANNP
jgi:hypothetical protein